MDISLRIVRDYEKYIARQFKRGTSRQELNVSWLKKNELELKRHINDLRENIRQNWSMTGQELGKDLRQLWLSSSRPASPARLAMIGGHHLSGRGRTSSTYTTAGSTTTTPTTTTTTPSKVKRSASQRSSSHLDVPRMESTAGNEFATGYMLGLIGGVRSWVCFLDHSFCSFLFGGGGGGGRWLNAGMGRIR